MRFLQNVGSLCTEREFEGGLLWCFIERTYIPSKELDAGVNLNVRYQEGNPVEFKNPGGKPCVFILDDVE